MELRPFGFLLSSLVFVLMCQCPIAQEILPKGAEKDAELEEASVSEIDSKTSRREHLEKALKQLNGLITDKPSRYHHERAGILFRLGRFGEAIQDYDMAARLGQPHDENSCWERGLAQYYSGDFRTARDQFSRYHQVGPSDIENGLWRFLCIAEEEGIVKARETMLEFPKKVRKPFPALLALYLDRGNAEAVLDEARRDTSSTEERTTNLFYAHYYLGKYYEILDQKADALAHIRKALKYEISHFMFACAEIDEKRLSHE